MTIRMTCLAALVLGVGCIDSEPPGGADTDTDDGESTITPAADILSGPRAFQCSTTSCSFDLSVNNAYGTCFLAGLKGRVGGTATHWGGASVNAHSSGEMFLDMGEPSGGLLTATVVCVENTAHKQTFEFDSHVDGATGSVVFAVPDAHSVCFLSKYKKFDSNTDYTTFGIYPEGGNTAILGTNEPESTGDVVGEAVCVDFTSNLGRTPNVNNTGRLGTKDVVVLDNAPANSICGLSGLTLLTTVFNPADGGELNVSLHASSWTQYASVGPWGGIDVQCAY